MKLLVVIVAFRSDALLPALAYDCARIDHRVDVVIVDNDGSGETRALVASLDERIESLSIGYLDNGGNRGYAHAVNRALERFSDHDVLAVLNPDVRFDEAALDRCLAQMAARGLDVAGPRLCDESGRTVQVDTAYPSVGSVAAGLLPRPARDALRRRTLVRSPREGLRAHWVSGAFMLVRADFVRAVGGMDERYFMYMEDVDWCRRLAARGAHIDLVWDATASHLGGASGHGQAARLFVQARLAKLIYFATWASRWEFWVVWAVFALEAMVRSLLGASLDGGTDGPRRLLRILPSVSPATVVALQFDDRVTGP